MCGVRLGNGIITSEGRMSYSYRCTRANCRARRSLKQHMFQYQHNKEPKCSVCGGRLTFDEHHQANNSKHTCTCDGLAYPHRRGSSVWCVYHPVGPTDIDFEEVYRQY